MKAIVIFVAVFALTACSKPRMANERIISEVKRCTDAGMRAVELHDNVFSSPWEITAIQCQQRRVTND